MRFQNPAQQMSVPVGEGPLILPFPAIGAAMLALVGGKAANLGELTRAGFPVPTGFCLTTSAYTLVTRGIGLESILDELAVTPGDDTTRLQDYAAAARASLLAAPVPASIVEAITGEYQALGRESAGQSIAVAVRSSATAEDLPFASFAGQQDTYLNIVGIDALLDAVRRCWSSLWTDRAVSYRASNGIDPRGVHLAVVVQRMVESKVAGVLFTANPLTGRRRQAVIDASPGLGEAVVSGAVNPDHFVINTATGEILERRLGDKRIVIQAVAGGGTERVELAAQNSEACLTDDQLDALAALGARVEAHYGAPQDTEWAIDDSGKLWLTQARPVTTLYPLPAGAPATDDILRVYLSVNVAQGVFRPFTPMGFQAFRLIASSIATFIRKPPGDPLLGPVLLVEAAQRLFIDATSILRTTLGRALIGRALQFMEARSAQIFEQIAGDPRLALIAVSRWTVFRTMFGLIMRMRAPLYVLQALFRPAAARARVKRSNKQLLIRSELPAHAGSAWRLAKLERLFLDNPPRVLSSIVPVMVTGIGAFALTGKLLGALTQDSERQTVLRGLPHNVTTEMDLALWDLAQQISADHAAAEVLQNTTPERLAQDYHDGALPSTFQQGLANFLSTYGHRAVAEIDFGLPRWSEDPTHIIGALANYLQLKNPDMAPDAQFRRGAREAEAMVVDLTRRAAHKGRLRGLLVGFCLRRTRDLYGLRETPKFYLVKLLARGRELLWPVGEELATTGQLEQAQDIFFISLSEARAALAGTDMRSVVRERRASYEHELHRRHVPRVLLSDGAEPSIETQATGSANDTLRGTPASAGIVTAKARVILDPTGARLEPGEILVAPSTDPGWTPLFLTASGLVMEMGGSMSHGSVVAREYGIPAVVGVPGATVRITTGLQITVDGAAGTVSIEQV
jgi:rifampicin phosphotransferase